jgi:hypothetical protein
MVRSPASPKKLIEVKQMRLVYWGLAVGGFVLAVSWLWGAIVAFSLTLLLIVGYEIWRQSRPLALSRRPRESKLKPDLAERSPSEAPQPAQSAVKPNAKPGAKFRIRLIDEQPVRHLDSMHPDQSTRGASAEAKLAGDRTAIQNPLTRVPDPHETAESSQSNAAESGLDALTNAPTVIESLDQIRFAPSGGIHPGDSEVSNSDAARAENQTPQSNSSKQNSSRQIINSHHLNSWGEPTIAKPQSSNFPETPTRPYSSAANEPTVVRPLPKPHSANEPIPRPFQRSSSADEKTVIGPSKAQKPKAADEDTTTRPFLKSDVGSPAAKQAADITKQDSQNLANRAGTPTAQSTAAEEPTVIGHQYPQPKQEEERTKL